MNILKLNAPDKTPINVTLWDDVEKPQAIIQIAHGMAEYSARYDDYASFLNSKGFIVVASDHRGHGLTSGYDKRGITNGHAFTDTLGDLAMVTEHMAYKYYLPVILLGHSYGSFLAQAYITKYGQLISGLALSGSAYLNNASVKLGALISKIQMSLFNPEKEAKLIRKMSFDTYNKPFKAEKLEFSWLSRDKNNVNKYIKDDFCGHPMSIAFQYSFLNSVYKIYSPDKLAAIPKKLPIMILSGDSDPVGNRGKLPLKLYEVYKQIGLENVEIKLYKDARHEILNEINKKEVYNDTLNFFKNALKTVKE